MADQRALIFNGKFFEEIEDSEIGDKKIVVYDPSLQMYKERVDEEGIPIVMINGKLATLPEEDYLII